jgi:hypothetical protein
LLLPLFIVAILFFVPLFLSFRSEKKIRLSLSSYSQSNAGESLPTFRPNRWEKVPLKSAKIPGLKQKAAGPAGDLSLDARIWLNNPRADKPG